MINCLTREQREYIERDLPILYAIMEEGTMGVINGLPVCGKVPTIEQIKAAGQSGLSKLLNLDYLDSAMRDEGRN